MKPIESRMSTNTLGSTQFSMTEMRRKSVKEKDLEAFKKEIQSDDHYIPLDAAVIKFNTNLKNGLTSPDAEDALYLHGFNCLTPPKTKSKVLIFFEYMFGGFAALLWIGAILSFIGFTVETLTATFATNDQLYIGICLVMVIVITGLFGYYQESANTAIMESFKKMVPKYATVMRDGQPVSIKSDFIVVGDIVLVQTGGLIPADIRVIESHGLKVDNSSITGESDPLPRSAKSTDKNLLESENVAFYGTNVVEGSGKGMVIACGDDTLMGHIAGLTSGLQPEETPLQRELHRFIKLITAVALVIGGSYFMTAILIGYSFFEAFIYLIAVIVGNVPEGLLVTMTASLTLTAQRMADKNCMVKKLHAIETLGATNTICSDKTGTLTQNRMTVSHMYLPGKLIDVLAERADLDQNSASFKNICRIAILCNRAVFLPNQSEMEIKYRAVIGDASETAVLKFMETVKGHTDEFRRKFPKVCEIPFNSTNKYQVSIHNKGTAYFLVMKGAPERIIDRCSTVLIRGDNQPLNIDLKKQIDAAILEMGSIGERVLAFADLDLPTTKYPTTYQFDATRANFPLTELRFVGLLSMIDPPKPGVPDAVMKCKSAGIRVVMVTGDHPVTALAIAKKVGIISPNVVTTLDICNEKDIPLKRLDAEDRARCYTAVITGSDLREMSSRQLRIMCSSFQEIVFARTSPQQKLKIVECFQSLGDIVAVTGDGVNDSPALKKGDIGVAMGISGSEVSKEAADMIILDDNFATIVNGIEEGRLIFDNLKKSIYYLLTSNVPKILPFVFFIALEIPQVLSVMAMIFIDVGTDLWPGISLAYEKAESDIMKRKPRDMKKDKLVNSRLICITYFQIGVAQAAAGFTCYFFLMATYGFFISDLIGIRRMWDAEHVNDLQDSFGREWTYEERQALQKKGYATYFLAILVTQVIDTYICKTRKLSLFQQGAKNWVMNTGILFTMFIAVLVVYCPGINTFMQMQPVDPIVIVPAVPFGILIFVYDEIRKYIIRKKPGGWVDRETYY